MSFTSCLSESSINAMWILFYNDSCLNLKWCSSRSVLFQSKTIHGAHRHFPGPGLLVHLIHRHDLQLRLIQFPPVTVNRDQSKMDDNCGHHICTPITTWSVLPSVCTYFEVIFKFVDLICASQFELNGQHR